MSAAARVAVVTGAARGIGRATAAALAKNGFRVALVDVRGFEMAGTAALVREAGSEALALEGDVTSLATAQRLAATVLAAWNRIDLLVNNAGISQPKGLLEITEEEWDRTIDTHLKGAFNWCKAVAPTMLAQRAGRIVNMSSVSAHTGAGTAAVSKSAYCAAKAGILGLTRGLAKELAPHVTVNAICPGLIATDLTAGMIAREGTEALTRSIPLARLGAPEDIARFHDEATAAGRLNHPGIVQVYDAGEHDGTHYFSMAYIEGESLAAYVGRDKPRLHPRKAAKLIEQVCRAVQYAHDRAVIHRDIKPANIMVDKSGQPLLTDFGLAKLIGNEGLTALVRNPHALAREHEQRLRDRPGVGELGMIRGTAPPTNAHERRLEHQRMRAGAREIFDQRPRGAAACLLIGVEQHPQRPAWTSFQRPQRVEQADDAALHVEHARPARHAAFDAERVLRQAAQRPDRIVVAERERRVQHAVGGGRVQVQVDRGGLVHARRGPSPTVSTRVPVMTTKPRCRA